MPTTTNFGWTTPADTALVKDGASAIRTLGSGIDTSFVDFKGGTTGQVLKKTSGTDLDVEWGTASSGLTLINTTTFSGVSSVSVPASTFSATYDNYLVRFNNLSSTVNEWAGIRLRAAGTDDSGANYRKQVLDVNGTSVSAARTLNSTSWLEVCYQNTSVPNMWTLEIQNPFLSEVTTALDIGGIESNASPVFLIRFFGINTTTSYDSFTLIAASGNITGSISVYGLSK